ncbi:prephenate dehydrogenase [Candidatus Mycalebacterium sp.]
MKISVIGLGQIGASLCAALKETGAADEITGADTNSGAVSYCVSKGLIDRGFKDAAEVPPDTDICVLAVPVDLMRGAAAELFSTPRPGTVVTDVGSVKESVAKSVESILPPDVFFVPAHPIAGSEKQGAEGHQKNIFKGNPVIITGGSGDALSKVEDMWKKTGAKILKMSAREHDRIFAFISHLPHACAYSLSSVAATAPAERTDVFSISGGGLKDTTRIAMSDPDLWAGILIENRENVLEALEGFSRSISEIARSVKAGDKKELARLLEKGRAAKDLFVKNDRKF